MEPYIEMLMNGGHLITYEIHDCDYSELEEQLRWEVRSDDFKREMYYDTRDSTLEKQGSYFQVTELISGHALLSVKLKDTQAMFQYLYSFDSSQSLEDIVDAKIAKEIKAQSGISVSDLKTYSASAYKSCIVKYKSIWIVLSAEIVYGSHQASLSCFCNNIEDGETCLNAILRSFQIRKKSEKPRAVRFRREKNCKLMEGTPEQNKILYPCLLALGKGYETGIFDDFFPYLADECEKTSQWDYETVCGKDNIIRYFRQKGELSQKSESRVHTRIVELVGNMNISSTKEANSGASIALLYSEGKLCLYLVQFLDGETIRVLVDLELDEKQKVSSISLCLPELFNFKPFQP